jgi:hypothetical protein
MPATGFLRIMAILTLKTKERPATGFIVKVASRKSLRDNGWFFALFLV